MGMATASVSRKKPALASPKANGVADGLCLCMPVRAATLAGFRAWVTSDDFPEWVRVTFVDQEIYLDMSKEELETHAKVKAEVCRVLLNLAKELKTGDFYLDGVLISNEAAEFSNNPDALFVLLESIEKNRVRMLPREGEEGQFLEIEGTPDWVLEVISHSSVTKDTKKLRRAYHRAGIREYWLIDARGDTIDFQILYWRKKGYVAAPNRDGWQRSEVFGREFRLVRERNRLGRWEYTLEIRLA
jgi:Uma2 family endonuclease